MKCSQICIGFGLLCVFLFLIALPVVAQDLAGSNSGSDVKFWKSVRDSNNIDMYREYVKRYPDGHFVSLAKIKIDTLSKNGPNKVNPDYQSPMPAKRFLLRSSPETLLEKDIVDFIKKYNFSVPKHNPNGHFVNVFVDNQDGTIADESTGLIWQKSSSNHALRRAKAIAYIEKLNKKGFAGRSTWRMPTLEELLSLMEHEPQPPRSFYLDTIFHEPYRHMAERVWSADKKEPGSVCPYGGWVVNFWGGTILQANWGGYQVHNEKNEKNYVKAVCAK